MLNIENIVKKYPGQEELVINNLSLEVVKGEFLSLLGPSGCGKTTLLRVIAGLDQSHEGQIFYDGKAIQNLPPQKRPFHIVFQKHALFPHLSVFDNIAYGLRLKKITEDQIRLKVQNILHLVNLNSMESRFPESLSGGQAQRVALARALVNEPKVLLLDEPLSALDEKLRQHMQLELRQLQKKLNITFIFVTHDQEEAFVLSDRVALMNKGKIEQLSSPTQLYENPQSLFVTQFIGKSTQFEISHFEEEEDLWVHFSLGPFRIKAQRQGKAEQNLVTIRPENILINKKNENLNWNYLKGKIINKIFKGRDSEIEIEIAPGVIIWANVAPFELSFQELKINQDVELIFDPRKTLFFKKDSL